MLRRSERSWITSKNQRLLLPLLLEGGDDRDAIKHGLPTCCFLMENGWEEIISISVGELDEEKKKERRKGNFPRRTACECVTFSHRLMKTSCLALQRHDGKKKKK